MLVHKFAVHVVGVGFRHELVAVKLLDDKAGSCSSAAVMAQAQTETKGRRAEEARMEIEWELRSNRVLPPLKQIEPDGSAELVVG